MNKEFDIKFKDREKSVISEYIYLQLSSTFICDYNYISYQFEKCLDIPITIPNINE